MTDRIIDISDRPAHLSVRNSLLVIRFGHVGGIRESPVPLSTAEDVGAARNGSGDFTSPISPWRGKPAATAADDHQQEESHTIPLADLAVVIASHPQISYTHAVLSGLAAAGAVFVTCNEKHLPVAMLLPLVTHSLQAERFAAQANVSAPTRKRVWQQIVQVQIRARARLLSERTGKDWGLELMAGRVRSGDPKNHEAQAARIYWRALFGSEFLRDREEEGVNACLNYGLGVLRATVARALCGAGLLPALGLHHHNRYDAFCLADDLMEPFRPIVDHVVVKIRDERGDEVKLDKEAKQKILEGLLGRFTAHNESRTLFDWVSRAASSLAAVIEGKKDKLDIALLTPHS